MAFTLYCIQNLINGKLYIGKTIRPIQKRWKHHIYDHYRKNYPLYRAMRRYGAKNFQLVVLSDCDTDHDALLRREIAYIKLFGTMDRRLGYNMHPGGAGQERCEPSPGTREKLRQVNLGHHFSAESRRRMSESAKKRWKESTPEVREAVVSRTSKAHKGKKRPAEWVANMRLGRIRSGKAKGYSFVKATNKWQAYIGHRPRKHLGFFNTEEEAMAARKEAVAQEIANVVSK